MANGFDMEYSTQYFPEVDFLKDRGINPTFVKSNEYGIRLHKYTKTKKLFEALIEFYK